MSASEEKQTEESTADIEKQSYNDPTTYREMQVPFESTEQASEAVAAFFNELTKLRKRHGIANVHTIVQVNVGYEDGDEGSMMTTLHLGSTLEAVGMCAFAYGRQKQIFENRLAVALKGKR